jgi:hypothetical protein
MDEIIDRRFERVEKALATLINSISTYNPAPALANDLVTADAELSQGLEQRQSPPCLTFLSPTNLFTVSTHQSNHAKILSLRTTSQDLDAQIRETLTLLTSTRSALISTPSTVFPGSTHEAFYSELLSYARRISKFTVPSGHRETEPAEPGTNTGTGEAAGTNTPRESKSGTQTNGTSTPVTAAAGITNGVEKDTQMDIDSQTPGATQQTSQVTNTSSNTALPPSYTAWLNPPPDMFIPWPNEEVIRRGALASIQVLIDQGVDPATFDPAKSEELEAERKRIVEEEDRVREEEKARVEEVERREVERRMSGAGAGGGVGNLGGGERQEKAAAFQLETFDDDDED